MGIFDRYFSESSFDEMVDAQRQCRPHWQTICDQIEATGIEGLKAKQAELDWSLEENGVTYNVYDAPDGITKRRWTLDPIPFVVTQTEWDRVVKGLRQRAKLFDLMLRDLYGDQHLLRQGILPAEVVYAHKGYAPEVFGFGHKTDFELFFYATDMARGPDGKFWVVNDRIQAPSGLGYAVENRLSMNIIAKSLYPGVHTRRLAGFIDEMKSMIDRLSGGDRSKAALLTPGPHNETYFEHAYLSSLLEISLVQGEDLLSKDGALWLKNLSGLTRINTLLRRVDDRYCDPLELKSDSHLGVAGLVDAARRENLAMINPVGSGILENLGFNPFMKNIAKFFLDEELILPQIATWWCGQPGELEYVLKHLDKLIVKHIDRTESATVYFGRKMDAGELDALRARLKAAPHLYVAQEEIGFSTVPYFTGESVEPRNAVIRSYAFKRGSQYWVMNGGLVRVASQKDAFLISSQKGGTSKDLWIVGEEEERAPSNPFKQLPCIDASIDQIPTRRAENLFWLGRYLSRAIITTRLIRYAVKRLINVYRDESNTAGESQHQLLRAITHMTMTYPGFLDKKKADKLLENPMKEIVSVLKEQSRVGSLSFTLAMLSGSNVSIKNLLGIEAWKLFDKLQWEWQAFCSANTRMNRTIVNEMDKLHVNLLAYKELVEESMFREQGLVLYDIGYRMESVQLLISKARSLLCPRQEKAEEYELLEALLNTCESFNAYRAHYRSALQLENVIEFLLLNPQYPKSLTYQTQKLLSDLKDLPKSRTHLTQYEAPIFQAYSRLKLATAQALLTYEESDGIYTELDTLLSELSELFMKASDEFSKTYFSHYDE
ncbi:circularly permuted type 2 ATP-grasp protein [Thiomicrolovo sp. ZZH C-3]